MDANISQRGEDSPEASSKTRIMVQIGIIIAVLALGGYGYSYLSNQKVRPKRTPPARLAPVVQISPLKPTTVAVRINAMGTVVPAQQLILKSRVGGQVVRLHPHFVPGGLVRAGEELVRLDDADYTIAVTRAKGNLAEAEHALNLEMGYQEVARKEWELLNGQATAEAGNPELALRKSHLVKARALVEAARAELQRANLDLQRTRLTAPFNAMIQVRQIEDGSQVGPQENLATLVGTDAYWVQVSLPVDRLAWLEVPRNGDTETPRAEIDHIQGGTYEGRVIRLLGDLSDQGRMARLLVEVPDPLGLKARKAKSTPLLLGEYVRVNIQGQQLVDVFAVPRDALKDNQFVWLARADDTLEIRAVKPVWQDADLVYLREGVQPGERLIISDLAGPVANMPIQIAATGTDPAPAEGADPNRWADPLGEAVFEDLDRNGDGRVTAAELARAPLSRGTPQEILRRWDRDGDGGLSPEEFAARRRPPSGTEG